MYCILEDNRGRLSLCPQNWIKTSADGTETLYWPKSNQNSQIGDPDSEPVVSGQNKWLIVHDKVKRRNIPSKSEAELEMEQMLEQSKTETETEDDGDERNATKLRSHRKLFTKAAMKTVVPKFNVPVSMTPPNSALKNHTMVSVSASPKTPTTKSLKDASICRQQALNVSTPPSEFVQEDVIAMQSVFNMPIQNQLDIFSEDIVSKLSVCSTYCGKINSYYICDYNL